MHVAHHGEGLAADGVGETGSDGNANLGAAQTHALQSNSCTGKGAVEVRRSEFEAEGPESR